MQKLKDLYNKYPSFFATIQLLFFLYLFVFSLDLMGTSLKLFGKEFSQALIESTTNPFVGLFIGIIATSIIQSSSSTTSIIVGMVAGGALTIENAIPMVMGANIGTSITNTIASLPQINRSNEFQRAFAAATVHDFFNFLSVIVIFPIQLTTNYLGYISERTEEFFGEVGGLTFLSPVKAITKPVVKLVQDSFGNFIDNPDILSWTLFAIALLILFASLKNMVASLKVLVVSKAKVWFDKYLFKTSVRAFFVGILLTILVQSSSITTSLVVPMAGAGLLTLMQIFPYTLGSNIGTTVTAMLAALITGEHAAVAVAFAHLIFNISGIVFWWPLKRVPVTLAQKFAEYSTKSKIVPVGYILVLFFLIPILVITLFN